MLNFNVFVIAPDGHDIDAVPTKVVPSKVVFTVAMVRSGVTDKQAAPAAPG